MRISPPTPTLVTLFSDLLARTPGVPRRMFGCPCGFLNGNMFMGVYQDQIFLRLSETDRAELLSVEGATRFDPMGGRPMREYVVLPPDWLEGDADDQVHAWLAKSVAYARTLPPKNVKKSPRPRTRT